MCPAAPPLRAATRASDPPPAAREAPRMGLFGKKKKQAAADEAAAAVARQQAAAAAAAAQHQAQVAAAEAERKAKAEAEKSKEEQAMANITAKRQDIKQLERALAGFEADHKRLTALALKARQEKRVNDMKTHMRAATRIKNRINQYNNAVIKNQEQLDALEDVSFMNQNNEKTNVFVGNMQGMAVDAEKYEENLQDMREQMDAVNDLKDISQADANLSKTAYDEEEYMAELDALEAEQSAAGAASEIPAVPGNLPKMPVAAAPTTTLSEEEEIRKLEAGIGM